jgi:hypothetical protein
MEIMTNEISINMEKTDDEVFFAPLDQIRFFEKIIVNLETTFRELLKVAEGMKPIEN